MRQNLTSRKTLKRGILSETILSWAAIFSGGSILILHTARIIKGASLTGADIRSVSLAISVLLILIILSAAYSHRKSVQKAEIYKDILGFLPMPVLLTDYSGVLQYANKAAEDLLSIDSNRVQGRYHTRHLFNEDGDVSNKTWIHDGTAYLISGTHLTHSGIDYGYLVVLDQVYEPESSAEQARLFDDALRVIDSLITVTKYVNSSAGAVKELADFVCDITSGVYYENSEIDERIRMISGKL